MYVLRVLMEINTALLAVKDFIPVMANVYHNAQGKHSHMIQEHALSAHHNALHALIFMIIRA